MRPTRRYPARAGTRGSPDDGDDSCGDEHSVDRQFRLLTGGPTTCSNVTRHWPAIDWSYNLLNDDERTLLERLSVCNGGFDLDTVTAIAARTSADEYDAIDLLRSLVAKSLVERNERNGTTRYRMLEMISPVRSRAARRQQPRQRGARRHARHYLAVAISLFNDMRTERDYDALDELELETPNVTAALRWLLANHRLDELLSFYGDVPSSMPSPLPHLRSMISLPSPTTSSPRTDVPPGRRGSRPRAGSPTFTGSCTATWSEPDNSASSHNASPTKTSAATGSASTRVLVMLDGHLDQAATFAAEAVERARRGDDTGETV